MSYICTSHKTGSEPAIFLIMWFFVFGAYYIAATKIIFNNLYTHWNLNYVCYLRFLFNYNSKHNPFKHLDFWI